MDWMMVMRLSYSARAIILFPSPSDPVYFPLRKYLDSEDSCQPFSYFQVPDTRLCAAIAVAPNFRSLSLHLELLRDVHPLLSTTPLRSCPRTSSGGSRF